MRDSEGNLVPNPIPNKYVCETLTVYYFGENDTCISELLIRLEEGLRIFPRRFSSISAQNYNANRVPRPRVQDCTAGDVRVIDATDEFINYCDDVPRVVTTCSVTNKCGITTTATQNFDLLISPVPSLADAGYLLESLTC